MILLLMTILWVLNRKLYLYFNYNINHIINVITVS